MELRRVLSVWYKGESVKSCDVIGVMGRNEKVGRMEGCGSVVVGVVQGGYYYHLARERPAPSSMRGTC